MVEDVCFIISSIVGGAWMFSSSGGVQWCVCVMWGERGKNFACFS